MTSFKDTGDLAIPQGSLILVTGATGHIGGHVIEQALKAGFKVRGTARSQDKCDHTIKLYNNPNYETAIVKDIGEEHAFDDAVKGVDAIIHVASIVTFSPDPNEVITPTVAAAVAIMKAALHEPSVKRFVYTSSSTAATYAKQGVKFHIDQSTWNKEVEPFLHLEPPYKDENAFGVYGASKTKAEEAVWDFVKEHKPKFVVNTVLPNMNIGRVLDSTGATGGLVIDAYNGKVPYDFVPSQYIINVVDDARIHLAAAIDKTLANERILAFDEPFTWTQILEILREIRPNKKLADPIENEPKDLSTVDNELGAQLLKKWWGQDGYTGIKKSVEDNMAGIE